MRLQSCERAGFHASPGEGFVLLHKVCERFRKRGIVFYESSVEVGKTKETVDATNRHGRRPIHNGFYLGIIHSDAVPVDKHPQIFYLRFVKRALFGTCKEVVIVEALQNLLHLGLMFSKRTFGENHDVINVDNYDIFHISEDFVHHSLEGGGRVAETKEHDCGFVGSSMADKRSFPFVTFLNSYVVVSPPKVYLCEVLRSLELVDKLRDEWERVVVPYCVLVQVPVVLNHLLSSVFLRHEEYRGGLFRLRWTDVSFGELFVNELRDFFLLHG